MMERLAYLWPEIALFTGTCIVMVMGLSHNPAVRRLCSPICGIFIAAAGLLAAYTTPWGEGAVSIAGQTLLPNMPIFAKVLISVVGLILLLLLAGTVDRQEEGMIARGKRAFDPLRTNRAEFYAFYLFSLTGLMLCASADDLIWLFLALELTSLPTYIMVTLSTSANKSRESGVKYFFLGALGAAIFLFGFTFIYGGTGTTNLNAIHAVFVNGGINSIALAGLVLSLVGLGFKIASVPMHFYTADVYEGAAAPVTAMLAFVPKTAGFISILLICATVGWQYVPGGETALMTPLSMPNAGGTALPEPIRVLLWVIAAMTMTVGNVLAVLQTSIKRMLAYSSIAHSGYMLVGVIVGPGNNTFATSGVSAVMFYLLVYGVMNVAPLAVVASLEKPARGEDDSTEPETLDDLRGLWKRRPALAAMMVIGSLALLGFPPLLGFFGKVPLFTAGISAGEITLVIILGLNSAIGAYYYLRLAAMPFLAETPGAVPAEAFDLHPRTSRTFAAALSASAAVVLALAGSQLMDLSAKAGVVDARVNGMERLQPFKPKLTSVEEGGRPSRGAGGVEAPAH